MKFRFWSAALMTLSAVLYCINSGSSILYILYTLFSFALIQFVNNKNHNAFLKFISFLYFLGGWAKITVHGIFDYPYVERNGYFAGTPDEWNQFFSSSIIICSALIISFLLSKCLTRTQKIFPIKSQERITTDSFAKIASCFIVVIYALNWQFGFYRIGVSRELSLPFGLDAPASFMVYLVAPALAAILANDSVVKNAKVTKTALFYLSLVSIIAAIVTYSRSTVAVIMLPIAIGMYKQSRVISNKNFPIYPLFVFMGIALIVSLIAVSLQRISVYGGSVSPFDQSFEIYISESLGLFVDRWIGAEGMMVAVSSKQSIDLFLKMIFEDPTIGTSGIYQQLSLSQYYNLSLDGKTFLTLPGVFAILAFSGSFAILFFGVLLISIVGVSVDRFISRNFGGNYPLHYLISGSLAYHFSQMVFPRLFLPFIIQLAVFLIMLKLFIVANSQRALNLGLIRLRTH